MAIAVAVAIASAAMGFRLMGREGDEAVITRGRWSGLDVRLVSPPGAPPVGGRAVVLLHGFGGHPEGAHILRLARVAAVRERVRVFLPAGIQKYRSGWAWWGDDGKYWPPHAGGDEQGDALRTDPPLAAARAAVQALLREVRTRFAPETIVLAGHSQGGMLAMDVALARNPPVDRVAVLSSTILAASLPGLRAAEAKRPPVLVIHGREDRVVPFASGERLKLLLERHGHVVSWRPFDGGHRLPPSDVVDDLVLFLGGRGPAPEPGR